MNPQIAKNPDQCPRAEIAAYIDGDLSPRAEMDLEMHFALCEICDAEYREQKKLLLALDHALDEEKIAKEIALPEDFAKVIIANAESSVSGLRGSRERFNALFICSGLFLFVILLLGSETEAIFSAFGKFFDQFMIVVGFVGHLAYDVAVGITVILRSLCLQFVYKSIAVTTFFLFICGLSAYIFSRLVFRFNRI